MNPKTSILNHYFPICITLIVTFIALIGSDATEWLRFDRDAIFSGQVWRLVTGHLVHLGWSHLILNLIGLVLIWLLFGSSAANSQWLLVFMISALGCSLCLLWLNPELRWYVGLSGVLHTLFVLGCLFDIKRGNKSTWVLLLVIISKLLWEQLYGPMPGSEETVGGKVIVDAHLYGALIGLLVTPVLMLYNNSK